MPSSPNCFTVPLMQLKGWCTVAQTETLCCQRQSIAEPQPHNKYCQKRMRSDEHSFSSGKKPAQQDSHINTEINSGKKYPSKGGHLFSPFYCYWQETGRSELTPRSRTSPTNRKAVYYMFQSTNAQFNNKMHQDRKWFKRNDVFIILELKGMLRGHSEGLTAELQNFTVYDSTAVMYVWRLAGKSIPPQRYSFWFTATSTILWLCDSV